MKEPPPYRDSMRGGDFRVTVDTISEAVHGRTITHTIRNNSTSATIMLGKQLKYFCFKVILPKSLNALKTFWKK